ncbi:hypothetical protein RHGRI_018292 [Rhododendron griersonianum]|uniref:Non-specific serine/threonine protein kinase n=1 Tax=Rhododendron griersonianum TaxID=479676 RepID=A0AAV6K0X0_9ERIC|nr:hypothetical protein RHGRI_018292 [Rhododendron griersonianum]
MASAGLMKNWVLILLLILLPLFSHFPCGTEAYYADFPSANLSVSWKNTPFNEQGSLDFVDGSTLRPILLAYNVTQSYPPFGLGFFTNKTSISFSMPTSVFYLVVFMMTRVTVSDNNSDREYQFIPTMPPKVLWSANRDSPVGENATLDFTAEGDLVLRDEFGNLVWSTNTGTKYVARMEIGVTGNLMLLNGSNGMVWQSYDHPTDTWLPNQKINNGQRLTASNSSSNLSTGIYYLTVDKEDNIGIRAFVDSDPPEEYATLLDGSFHALGGPAFGNAYNAIRLYTDFAVFYFNLAASPTDFRFIVLEPDGHKILYFVDTSYPYTFAVEQRSDLLAAIIDSLGDCSYPAVCGSYGVCSGGGQCACPQDNTGTSNYFWPFAQGIGCAEITPLSCDHGSKYHTFVDLPYVTYFDFVPTLFATTIDECKEACLNNCSCKAALFRYDSDVSSARQKIIYGVAKGLQYLHEDCHKNIIHFDIKPQNILLDRDFNAKISDFGLARLIDGTHSLVLTSLKGTIGYLAPEMYRGSHISVKADIYSFGVVIVETICGRKNLDKSDQESMPLVEIVQTKAGEDQLYDLIDDQDEDIWQHKEEAIKMMKIGIWCLQTHDRRPCMSTVVKVLEGSEGIDPIPDHHG